MGMPRFWNSARKWPLLRRFAIPDSTPSESPFSSEQIALIKASWAKVLPIQDTASMMMYGRLFELNPRAAKLFAGPITDQGRKMMAMIGTTVLSLDDAVVMIPAIESLGRRHKFSYKVKESDYTTVGEALMWMLEKALGPDLTPEVREAWISVYGVLSQTMMNGARKAT